MPLNCGQGGEFGLPYGVAQVPKCREGTGRRRVDLLAFSFHPHAVDLVASYPAFPSTTGSRRMTDSPEATSTPALEEGALRLLGRREHSREELRKKLRKREWPADRVEALLDRLEQEGALSDLRFARSWVRHRAGRGLGPTRIRSELRQRGVAPEVVARAFQAFLWRRGRCCRAPDSGVI